MKLRGRHKLVVGIVCAFAVFAAYAPLKSKTIVDFATEAPTLDKLHALALGLGFLPAPQTPVTLIRIDDQAFDAWNRPFPFEKARIVELVKKARQGNPSAILVDLDISTTTSSSDTDALRAYLDERTDDDVPLLFPRELGFADGEKRTRAAPSTFDISFNESRNLFWVNVLFERDNDLKIRNWNLWEIPSSACKALLAPPLLDYAMKHGGTAMIRYAQNYLAVRERPDCQQKPPIDVAKAPNWLAAARKNGPIQFSFADNDATISTIMASATMQPALIQFPALQFLAHDVAQDALAGRFVIIGNSYADNGDFHDTPAGEMEGMRVIANAVANASVALEPPASWMGGMIIAVSLVLGGVVAVLLITLRPFVSGPLALAAGIVVYSLSNRWFGPVAAHDIVQNAAVISVLAIAADSLESICHDLLIKKQRWKSFRNG